MKVIRYFQESATISGRWWVSAGPNLPLQTSVVCGSEVLSGNSDVTGSGKHWSWSSGTHFIYTKAQRGCYYRILPNKCPGHLKNVKRVYLLGTGKFYVDSAKTLAFFLKYGDVVTTQVPSTHYWHPQRLVDWKFFVNLSFTAEFAMIQTHKTLLYVNWISLFLHFVNSRGGAYSILLGKVWEGRL